MARKVYLVSRSGLAQEAFVLSSLALAVKCAKTQFGANLTMDRAEMELKHGWLLSIENDAGTEKVVEIVKADVETQWG